MYKSLENFMEHLIDYAGLFPPAGLSLKEAFCNYLKYSKGLHREFLNKFICPANLLPELSILMDENVSDSKIDLSVILSGGKDEKSFLNSVEMDFQALSKFLRENTSKVTADTFECRLPQDLSDSLKIGRLISSSHKICSASGVDRCFLFFELTSPDNRNSSLNMLTDILKDYSNFGFKLRTGGTEASAFPDSSLIAYSISECHKHKIKMKFTAGLHHPVRRFDDSVLTKMHGFINVFTAGILAYNNVINPNEIENIISDEDQASFIFKTDYLQWNSHKVSNEQIKSARENFVISYGSCSFTEPIDDLKTLGLIE